MTYWQRQRAFGTPPAPYPKSPLRVFKWFFVPCAIATAIFTAAIVAAIIRFIFWAL